MTRRVAPLRAAQLAEMAKAERDAWIAARGKAWQARKLHDWAGFWARLDQLPPDGDWRTWLVMAGRGYGKTRMGAEWVRALAEADGTARIALVAATAIEARLVMVEGESGLLATASPGQRPRFEASLRRLSWPSGARAWLYSAAEPDQLRGPQHSAAWADEIAKWPFGEAAWDNLMMGLRLGDDPRAIATTTPRPLPWLRKLMAMNSTVRTGGATEDNRAHLPPSFLADMVATYGDTRLGRQELGGELIEDVAGALWTRTLIEASRARTAPALRRVVIGVDPPAGAGAASDACGIVAVGLGEDGRGYVIADDSVQGLSPEGWARAVAASAGRHRADRVVAEANNGGAMVESVLRAADVSLPVRCVHASKGKVARAEPVAALYEAGRVAHIGAFPALEDEMAGLARSGPYDGPGRSPDRADALVWALWELMLGEKRGEPALRLL